MIEQIAQLGFQKDPSTSVWFRKEQKDFSYSDGDETENYLLESIRASKDRSISSLELRGYIRDWPTLYHLSRRRSNILRPFASILKGKTVLEIGCGCGALSRFLGEAGARLFAVEGSPRRALITRERCRDMPNVEVVTASSEAISAVRNFDFVILNGVLEYSPKFLGASGPALLLKSSYDQLNQNGMLILSIENQLGLKYFAGQNEDHAGQPMYGINDSYRNEEFKTWGKKELTKLILDGGFQTIHQYIPLPDYKLPVSIVTPLGWQNFQNELVMLAIDSVSEDPQRNADDIFSQEMGYKNIWNNGLASDLANSFLMVAHKKSTGTAITPSNILAYSYRDNEMNTRPETREIYQDGKNLKERKYSLDDIFQNEKSTSIDFPLGENYWFGLVRILNRPDWTIREINRWAEIWISALKNFAMVDDSSEPDAMIDNRFGEATPLNTYFGKSGELNFDIRQDEGATKVSLGYVVYCGLRKSFQKLSTVDISKTDESMPYADIMRNIFFDAFQSSRDREYLQKIWHGYSALSGEQFGLSNFSKATNCGNLVQRNSVSHYKSKTAHLENANAQIYVSFSWRVTLPLRLLIGLIKKLVK